MNRKKGNRIMPCYHPLTAYKLTTKKNENGKSIIFFNSAATDGIPYEKISLPCSNCIGCRIDRSKQWALRCVHEASLFENNCFITLTFNDENLNPYRNLDHRDFQKFIKRLRKKYNGLSPVHSETGKSSYPIRYFHCGEYGSDLMRPHHHACLFNFDFLDKKPWSNSKGITLYRSESLEKLWPFGYSAIGSVTYQSAAYIARYITKKINGPAGEEHYQQIDFDTGEVFYKKPEYISMSRRPGIGARWFGQFKTDLYPKDFVTHKGVKQKVPKFYDNLYDVMAPTAMEQIKYKRKLAILARKSDNTYQRLRSREQVQLAKAFKLVREYENHEKTNV